MRGTAARRTALGAALALLACGPPAVAGSDGGLLPFGCLSHGDPPAAPKGGEGRSGTGKGRRGGDAGTGGDPAAPRDRAPAGGGGDRGASGEAGTSVDERDLLRAVADRHAALDARERALAVREQELAAREAELAGRLAELARIRDGILAAQAELRSARGQADAEAGRERAERLASLGKALSQMKPAPAASFLQGLELKVAQDLLKDMPVRQAARVLEKASPEFRERLGVSLSPAGEGAR